jgi:hypothetical protein
VALEEAGNEERRRLGVPALRQFETGEEKVAEG